MTRFSLLTNPATVSGVLLAIFLLVKDVLEFKTKPNKENHTLNKKNLSAEVKIDPLASLKTGLEGRS